MAFDVVICGLATVFIDRFKEKLATQKTVEVKTDCDLHLEISVNIRQPAMGYHLPVHFKRFTIAGVVTHIWSRQLRSDQSGIVR